MAALTFFVWSILAGFLLKLEHRYIGLSFSVGTICLVYLYLCDVTVVIKIMSIENQASSVYF